MAKAVHCVEVYKVVNSLILTNQHSILLCLEDVLDPMLALERVPRSLPLRLLITDWPLELEDKAFVTAQE